MYSPASSSLHACCERKKQVTCGITYIIWLLVASPTVRFRNSPPSSLIFLPLALTSILVVAARLCLEIPIYMVMHLPTMHIDTSVSLTVNCPKTEFFSIKKIIKKCAPLRCYTFWINNEVFKSWVLKIVYIAMPSHYLTTCSSSPRQVTFIKVSLTKHQVGTFFWKYQLCTALNMWHF